MQQIAESRANAIGLRMGRESSEAEIGVIVGQVRRSLSTTCVRAQAQCLLTRLNCLGQGYANAFKRRQWASKEEEKMKCERQAQWISRVRGRNLVSRGQFLLPK